MIATGPRWLGMASVPGRYWPFRSFPMSITAAPDQVALLLAELRRHIRLLRIGPVCAGAPGLEALLAVTRAKGWPVLDRLVPTRLGRSAERRVGEGSGSTCSSRWSADY